MDSGKPSQGENHCAKPVPVTLSQRGTYISTECVPSVLSNLRLLLGFALEYSSDNSFFFLRN